MLTKGGFLKNVEPMWIAIFVGGVVVVMLIAAIAVAITMMREDKDKKR